MLLESRPAHRLAVDIPFQAVEVGSKDSLEVARSLVVACREINASRDECDSRSQVLETS